MTNYWAVLLDETGCEFGAGVSAKSRDEAWVMISENYPESRVVQLESPYDTAEREYETYQRLGWELDNDY